MEKRKGLMAEIFRAADGHDCTNGGISSKVTNVVVVDDRLDKVFEEREGMPALVLVRRNIGGREYIHAEPADAPKDAWLMFGGNFVYTSDSRLREICQYPIPIHDRIETDYTMGD